MAWFHPAADLHLATNVTSRHWRHPKQPNVLLRIVELSLKSKQHETHLDGRSNRNSSTSCQDNFVDQRSYLLSFKTLNYFPLLYSQFVQCFHLQIKYIEWSFCFLAFFELVGLVLGRAIDQLKLVSLQYSKEIQHIKMISKMIKMKAHIYWLSGKLSLENIKPKFIKLQIYCHAPACLVFFFLGFLDRPFFWRWTTRYECDLQYCSTILMNKCVACTRSFRKDLRIETNQEVDMNHGLWSVNYLHG